MGIDVNAAKVVTFNPAHEHRVVTDPTRPVPHARIEQLDVVSIFRRRKVRTDNADGNSLIYALKGKLGYTMPGSDGRQILRAARTILPIALRGLVIDAVVPLPSSSPLAQLLAARAARLASVGPPLVCLDKATVGQVLASAPPTHMVERRLRGDYTSELARLQRQSPGAAIEMKTVKVSLRPYFTPIVTNVLAGQCQGRHVLLVDDIVGSGSSLMAAAAGLRAAGATSICALTLLGQLR